MIVTATLLDKQKYFSWAQRAHRLSFGQSTTLHYLLIDILGRNGQPPHNGWTSARWVARETGLSERTVQRAWDRLEELRLIQRTGAARGRGGCTHFHVPAIQGAAEKLKAMETEAARQASLDAESPDENTTGAPYPRRRKYDKPVAENTTPLSYNPFLESPLIEEPLVGGRGEAAAGAAGAAGVMSFDGDEEGPLTRPRANLLARLRGWAGKAGHELTNGFLEHVGPDLVQRWLRLNRANSDPHRRDKLFAEAVPALAGYLGVSPVELGAAIAAAKPEQPKTPSPLPSPGNPPAPSSGARSPAPPPVSPPPAASMRLAPLPPFPGRWSPKVNAGGGWQYHGCALPTPHKPKPRPPLQLTAEHLLASGARLGIPKRAAEGRR